MIGFKIALKLDFTDLSDELVQICPTTAVLTDPSLISDKEKVIAVLNIKGVETVNDLMTNLGLNFNQGKKLVDEQNLAFGDTKDETWVFAFSIIYFTLCFPHVAMKSWRPSAGVSLDSLPGLRSTYFLSDFWESTARAFFASVKGIFGVSSGSPAEQTSPGVHFLV